MPAATWASSRLSTRPVPRALHLATQVDSAPLASSAYAHLGKDEAFLVAMVYDHDIDHDDTPTSPLAILKPAPQVGDYAVALPALADGDPVELDLRTIAATSINVPITDNLNLHGLRAGKHRFLRPEELEELRRFAREDLA